MFIVLKYIFSFIVDLSLSFPASVCHTRRAEHYLKAEVLKNFEILSFKINFSLNVTKEGRKHEVFVSLYRSG